MNIRGMKLFVLILSLVGLTGIVGSPVASAEPIRLVNDLLSIEISSETGAFVSILNKGTGQELISDQAKADKSTPWLLFLNESEVPKGDYQSFDSKRRDDGIWELSWRIKDGLTLIVEANLAEGAKPLLLTSSVENTTDNRIGGFTYPYIRGIGAIAPEGGDDYLVHPYATGFRFKNPHDLFYFVNNGIQQARYPNGEQASMQFMAYYTEGLGGFYLAAHDPYMTAKDINFYKDSDDVLVTSFRHLNWDQQPNRGMELGYPVVIAPLTRGDWYEAADLYRKWASEQSWVERGKLSERSTEHSAKWLNEGVGISTFGTKGAYSTGLYERLHDVVQAPIFHILYGDPIPDGTNLHKDNLETIRRQGDYYSSFENDIIVPVYAWDMDLDAAIQPYQELAWGNWRAAWMNPVTTYIRERQSKRAEELLRSFDVDGFFYDISTSFAPLGCFNREHGHPLGYGRWMVEAYQDFHATVREAAYELKGEYIPMGTEMIHEAALRELDFYQARANAYPATFDYEGRHFKGWIETMDAEVIPLFSYVYHEYGGIRLDGWGQLSDEEGDYAYAIAARTALWGGLYQLNYEFNRFYGEPSKEKVLFLRDIAQARTDYGKSYLAYGKMQPMPVLDVEDIELDYHVVNLPFGLPERVGVQQTPAVISAAWENIDGNIGLFFINLQSSPGDIQAQFYPELYGWSGEKVYEVFTVDENGRNSLGKAQGQVSFEVSLPSRRVVMLEFKEASDR